MTRITLFLISSLVFSTLYSQETAKLSPAELFEDYTYFRKQLEDSHPGLYWYRNSKEIDQCFENLKDQLNQSISERAFYIELSKVVSKIGCGHTQIRLSKQSSQRIDSLDLFFPLQLYFDQGKAFVWKNFTQPGQELPIGSEVLSINQVPIDSIYNLSVQLLSGDGFIESGKRFELSHYFREVYAQYFGNSFQYNIAYRDKNGRIQEVVLDAFSDLPTRESAAAPTDLIQLDFLNKSTAKLKITSFFDWERKGKLVSFDKYLINCFNKIDSAGTTNLILDIRDNGGGRAARRLFSYFHDVPIAYFKSFEFIVKKEKIVAGWVKNPLGRWISARFYPTKKTSSDTQLITGEPLTKPYKPSSPQFQGNLFILINGGCFSTTSDFAAMMRSHGYGTFIGEETGGGYYGNTSFVDDHIVLPNSGIRLKIPLAKHTLPVEPLVDVGRGVLPDHYVRPTIVDLIEGRDVELAKALELIAQLK